MTMQNFMRHRRRQFNRDNPYRCSGVNSHGGRCLSSGTIRRDDGRLYCKWHYHPHPVLREDTK